MIYGELESIITTKIYDETGNLVSEKAKCIHKSILDWYDLVIGLIFALVSLHYWFMG